MSKPLIRIVDGTKKGKLGGERYRWILKGAPDKSYDFGKGLFSFPFTPPSDGEIAGRFRRHGSSTRNLEWVLRRLYLLSRRS